MNKLKWREIKRNLFWVIRNSVQMLLMNSVVMGSLMMDTTFCKYGHKTKKKNGALIYFSLTFWVVGMVHTSYSHFSKNDPHEIASKNMSEWRNTENPKVYLKKGLFPRTLALPKRTLQQRSSQKLFSPVYLHKPICLML